MGNIIDNKDITSKQETETMTVSKKIINQAQEFFTRVSALSTKLEVSQACNELLEELSAEYSVNTLSSNLTEFTRHFQNFTHSLPELNETINTKNRGTHTQHCAASMLSLTDEQKATLNQKRLKKSRDRDGFDADGELRIVDVPKCDIKEIVMKSVECLTSENPLIIACGIVNLTGLRAGEQNQPKYHHKGLNLDIERQMVALDDYVIGFKGVLKKHNQDDVEAFYARPTLAPAQLIVDAQARYLQYDSVQQIPTDINKYQLKFQKQFRNKYNEIFGNLLSTVEAFDDDGNLAKPNGSPHKGRAFYACALKNILRQKGFNSKASLTYVQLALAHDNVNETIKYIERYDEGNFINPININVPTNINGLGKMENAPVIETPIQTVDEGFNLDEFIEGMSFENNMKYVEFFEAKKSVTKAVLALIDYLSVNKKFVAKSENVSSQQPASQQPASQQPASQKTVSEDESTSKENVTTIIAKIVEGIMHYNRQIFNGENVNELAVPNYGLVNDIRVRLENKTVASTTVKTYTNNCTEQSAELEKMGIVGGFNNITHNSKYHRKTKPELIDRILEYSN